jgi:hypothetical protein
MDHENNKIKNLREKQENLKRLEELEREEMLWLHKL